MAENGNKFSISYNQLLYFNSNLPNLENQNGYYFPKGYGSFSSFLLEYNSNNLFFSIEPILALNKVYQISLPQKDKLFSVLNDVQKKQASKAGQFKNFGFKVHFANLSAGVGNWNYWWGPGIHNSLVLSNNADGFLHYFLGTNGYQPVIKDLSYNYKYMISKGMQNLAGYDYFFSAWFLNIKYNILEIGISRNIISGGTPDLKWTLSDATTVLLNNKNLKYWDSINEYYISANFDSGLKIFLDIAYPNRSYIGENPDVYSFHAIGSNLGLMKKGILNSNNLLIGVEYARLIQGTYFNILPTPNWYDNIKFNYSSFNERRWGAHSGSDSDDFLLFFGYEDDEKSFIYGFNYERHGVTYHFPPEVKIENRFNFTYLRGDIKINIIYENEYFEHYGFVDENKNVWTETFEKFSLQRTSTVLVSLIYKFSL